jgi:hypothetical protein
MVMAKNQPEPKFSRRVRELASRRAGGICSNPRCEQPAHGPGEDPETAINIGVAAHITARSVDGPRHDPALTPTQRASIDNAIWLCQSCAKLIDDDADRYTTFVIRDWKLQRENKASVAMRGLPPYREIRPSEQLSALTIGEQLAIRALEDEFGCHVETNVKVAAGGNGWIRLPAAVVHGEDLVWIELHEYRGGGFPHDPIKGWVQNAIQMKLNRFRKFVLYVFVVSSSDPPQLDEEVERHLYEFAKTAPCEVHIRVERLHKLRAAYEQ